MIEPQAGAAAPVGADLPLPKMMTEAGSAGLRKSGGYVIEDFDPALVGPRGRQTLRQMADNDPVIGAILFAMGTLLCNADWSVQAKSEDEADQAEAEFMESVLADMDRPMTSVMGDIVTMLVFGFAPLEMVFKFRRGPDHREPGMRSEQTDGLVGLRKLSLRAQETVEQWLWSSDGNELLAMRQLCDDRPQVDIPMAKIALFRTTEAKENPEGRSILRNAYRSYLFKARIEEIEGIGVERDLAGLPMLSMPARYMGNQASPEDKALFNTMKTTLANIRQDKAVGILLPSDTFPDNEGKPTATRMFTLELLSTGGSRQMDTTKIVDRYNRLMATSVLADFIFLGQSSVGSWSLSSDKTALFAAALKSILGSIANVWNFVIIPALWRLNGKDPARMPTMTHGDVETQDLTALAGYVSSLAAAGMPWFPDAKLENWMRDQAGMPPAPEEGMERDLMMQHQELMQAGRPKEPKPEDESKLV